MVTTRCCNEAGGNCHRDHSAIDVVQIRLFPFIEYLFRNFFSYNASPYAQTKASHGRRVHRERIEDKTRIKPITISISS